MKEMTHTNFGHRMQDKLSEEVKLKSENTQCINFSKWISTNQEAVQFSGVVNDRNMLN